MKETHRRLVTIGSAIVAVAAASLWNINSVDSEPVGWWLLLVLILVASLAGLHAPFGSEGLSLGAVVLPVAAHYLPAELLGLLAVTAWALRAGLEMIWLRRRSREAVAESALSKAAAAGSLVVASMAGLLGWKALAVLQWSVSSDFAWLLRTALAAGSYLIVLLALIGFRYSGITAKQTRGPLVLDAGGWILGGLAVELMVTRGWFMGFVFLGGCTVLSLEAARGFRKGRFATTHAAEQREAILAGHRIIFRRPDPQSIAEQILAECRKLLRFNWFHIELRDSDDQFLSWHSGAQGGIQEGAPSPVDRPPPRPGLHRRADWRIIERLLKVEGQEMARLKLWCDPRELQDSHLELLDSLLPQMGSAVQRAALDRKAKQDALTGLSDRGALQLRLDGTFQDCGEQGGTMAVVMCDIDHFKEINDEHGHAVGDQALVRIAKILELHRRDQDLCGRYGGEEFALILEKTDGQTALNIAERLRSAVETFVFVVENRRVPLRISAGVAAYPELHAVSGTELLGLADEALYEAKREGRNLALLNLGRKRYLDGAGEILRGDGSEETIEIPRLF